MRLTAPTLETAFYVCANMRQCDRDEIYAVRNHRDPHILAQEVMARPEVTWIVWHAGLPAVVLGGIELWRGVWSVHCFGTDDWHKLALPMTRFIKKVMLPLMFDEFGAHRLEADSICTHREAHRWMELCGAHKEGTKLGRGRNGEDYHTFVIRRDREETEEAA